MRGKTTRVLKTVVFCMLVAAIVVRTSSILRLKGKEYLAYYFSEQYREFYNMEKDIAKLADILGHGSINTTRIYIMTTGLEHRRKIERLGLLQ